MAEILWLIHDHEDFIECTGLQGRATPESMAHKAFGQALSCLQSLGIREYAGEFRFSLGLGWQCAFSLYI